MISVYFDEGSSNHRLVAALRREGIECLSTPEAGRRGRTDEEQLDFAAGEGHVLFTANVGHFGRLDREWRAAGRVHAGIIALSDQRAPIGMQLRALQNLAATVSAEEMRGRLEFLLRWA